MALVITRPASPVPAQAAFETVIADPSPVSTTIGASRRPPRVTSV